MAYLGDCRYCEGRGWTEGFCDYPLDDDDVQLLPCDRCRRGFTSNCDLRIARLRGVA